ncbi:MAG TPA: hypothetical protein VGA97_07020 [Acidimicrobiia bacterium]
MGMATRVRQDVLVAAVAFSVVFSVVYTLGRHFIHSHEIVSVLATIDPADQDGDGGLLLDLQNELLAVGYSTEPDRQGAAVAEVSGVVEARLLLDHVDRSSASLSADGESIHLSVTFSGAQGLLQLAASGVTLDVPTSEQVNATLTTDGRTFFGKDGACVLELARFEADADAPRGWEWAGHVTCTDVPEVRSDGTASFTVVFEVVPVQF